MAKKTKTAPKEVKEEKKEEESDVSLAIVQQLTKLSTSGFSLVAALAWNNVIQEAVNNYIKPYISKGSGIVSLLIYATLITMLAVLVTLQLAKLEQKIGDINRKVKSKVNQVISKKLKQ